MSHINPNDPRLGNQPAATRKTGSAKYRPVLTAAQIMHILTLAKTESPISQMSMSVIASLSSFQAKIENAAVSAAYIQQAPKPKANSLEALGGVPTDALPTTLPTNNISLSVNPAEIPKEEYWGICYEKYSTSPASCSLQEIEAAKEHMYLNDLMSPEEKAAFESGTGTGTAGNIGGL